MHRRALIIALVLTGCGPELTREDEAPDETGALEQGLRACPGATTVQGIDVSGYQPNTNWAGVAGAGKKFAIIKATEATGYVNPYFARDWAQAKANGVVRGAYHFFRPSYDGVAQADHFVATMGTLGVGDLPGMLDLEVTDGMAASTVVARMKAFLNRVEQRTGKRPLIYTGYYFWRDSIGNPQGYSGYPLVIAAYVSGCPLIPDQWAKFAMWQYSSSGQVAGVTTRVDLDVFNGSLTELEALAGVVPPPPPPPPAPAKLLDARAPTASLAPLPAEALAEPPAPAPVPAPADDASGAVGASCAAVPQLFPLAAVLSLAALRRRAR